MSTQRFELTTYWQIQRNNVTTWTKEPLYATCHKFYLLWIFSASTASTAYNGRLTPWTSESITMNIQVHQRDHPHRHHHQPPRSWPPSQSPMVTTITNSHHHHHHLHYHHHTHLHQHHHHGHHHLRRVQRPRGQSGHVRLPWPPIDVSNDHEDRAGARDTSCLGQLVSFFFIVLFFYTKQMFYCSFLFMKYATGRTETTRTSPNNARRVVWAIGK